MIVWLASYPRSGNTMLRAMLRQAFGMQSYSIYDDLNDIGANPEVRRQVGHEFLGKNFEEFYYSELLSKKPVFVKTHGLPTDSNRAIYVIRDGRSSIISYYNMLTQVEKRTDITVNDIILGEKVPFGDWSSHIRAWNPSRNPNTLLLHYRDLKKHPTACLRQISDFIGHRQVSRWRNNFGELHRLFPEFFARGSDQENIAQMIQPESECFWRTHGRVMREFGFVE